MLVTFGTLIIAYLLGSVPFGLLIARIAGITDIREHGSGNIGATNVSRVAGPKVAAWVYVADIGKAVLAVGIARVVANLFGSAPIPTDTFFVMAAVAVVVGHVFPVFLGFKGGKGVNSALGSVIVLRPIEALIAFGVFLLVAWISRYISLGSMCGVGAFGVVVFIERFLLHQPVSDVYLLLGVLMTVIVVVTHRANIGRLIEGTERRIGKAKQTSQGERHV